MADMTDINITGASFDDTTLPMWATEKTSQQMLKNLEKYFKKESSQLDDLKKELQNIAKAISSGNSLKTAGSAAAGSAGATAIFKILDEFGNQTKDATQNEKDLNDARKKTRQGLDDETQQRSKFVSSLLVWKDNILQSAGVFGFFENIYKQANAAFAGSIQLYNLGIQNSGASTKLWTIAHDFGIANLTQLTDVFQKYSMLVSQTGITGFRNLYDATNKATGGFLSYGMYGQEAASYLADYLEQQRALNVFDVLTKQQQAQAAAQNIKTITEFSHVLGVSRDEIEKNTKSTVESSDAQVGLQSLPANIRKQAETGLRFASSAFSSLGGKAGAYMNDTLAKMIAAPTATASSAYVKLAQVNGQAAAVMADYVNAIKSGGVKSADQTREYMARLNRAIQSGASNLALQNLSGELSDTVHNIAEVSAVLPQWQENVRKSAQSQKQADGAAQAAQRTQMEWARVQTTIISTLSQIFSRPNFQKGLVDGINKLADLLGFIADHGQALLLFLGGLFAIRTAVGIGRGISGITEAFGLAKNAAPVAKEVEGVESIVLKTPWWEKATQSLATGVPAMLRSFGTLLLNGIKGIGPMLITMFSGLVEGIVALLPVLGAGLAMAGAAWVGAKIGGWIDEKTGFGSKISDWFGVGNDIANKVKSGPTQAEKDEWLKTHQDLIHPTAKPGVSAKSPKVTPAVSPQQAKLQLDTDALSQKSSDVTQSVLTEKPKENDINTLISQALVLLVSINDKLDENNDVMENINHLNKQTVAELKRGLS